MNPRILELLKEAIKLADAETADFSDSGLDTWPHATDTSVILSEARDRIESFIHAYAISLLEENPRIQVRDMREAKEKTCVLVLSKTEITDLCGLLGENGKNFDPLLRKATAAFESVWQYPDEERKAAEEAKQ